MPAENQELRSVAAAVEVPLRAPDQAVDHATPTEPAEAASILPRPTVPDSTQPHSAFVVPTTPGSIGQMLDAGILDSEAETIDLGLLTALDEATVFSHSGQLPDPSTTCDGTRCLADHWAPWHDLPSFEFCLSPLSQWHERFWQTAGRGQSATCDLGIGHERVMYAPTVLDTAIGTPHIGMRFHADYGLSAPDRAGYYWAPHPLGPQTPPPPRVESNVDALDVVLRMELGNEKMMLLTQYSMRSINPELNRNTTGVGDMVIGAKALMVDGKRLKVASVFRTYLPTGVQERGLGIGLTALEPGALARYCVSPRTYLFGEMKYWTPLGGVSGISGDVLTTGMAISTIARESDVYAIIPTLEVRTLSFLFGGTSVGTDEVRRVDGETAVEIYPGARFVLGPEGDVGLWEVGVSTGFTVADKEWFDTRLLLELRWNY